MNPPIDWAGLILACSAWTIGLSMAAWAAMRGAAEIVDGADRKERNEQE